MVIYEIDEALRRLIRDEALPSAGVDVVFDAPTKDWAARRNAPTVNVYLYDIREDLRRRSRGLVNEYDERGMVRSRVLPPRYVKLSYLVTAWTQRPEDEHRLLSALLQVTMGYDSLPAELLTGAVAQSGLPVPMTVALPPPEDRAFADVWSALGGELKPSLDVVISVPMQAGKPVKVGPPVSDGLAVGLSDTTGGPSDPPVSRHVPQSQSQSRSPAQDQTPPEAGVGDSRD